MRLSRDKLNALDEELFEYNKITSIIAHEKLKIQTECELDDNIGGSRSGKISKPTEDLNMRYMNSPVIQRYERMKKEVDRAFKSMTQEQQDIFNVRWLIHDYNTWEIIAGKFFCSRKTIYRKREKILEVYAISKGEFRNK